MFKNYKTEFQDMHYNRKKMNFLLSVSLGFIEFFYKNVINIKNFLYEKNILKEKKVNAFVICVGNLTTGGVGKTPIVTSYANQLSKTKKVCVIQRGYGAKISNKKPLVIKDYNGLKFNDGSMCSDESYQLAKKVNDNVIVITCASRVKAANYAIIKYGIDTIILDDGFSNRKIKKDETIIVIDSKMRFGNNHLLPYGPLREPVDEIKRADRIILVDKGDKNLDSAITFARQFDKKISLCKMIPKNIYNISSKSDVIINKLTKTPVIAFCAIGQPTQFYDYLDEFYDVREKISFQDHYKYSKSDINNLIKLAKKLGIHTFITTQKDEAKLIPLVKDINNYYFNILELENKIVDI